MNLADYKHACRIAALLVSKFGDQYLSIFGRAHRELIQAEKQAQLKDLAVQFLSEK